MFVFCLVYTKVVLSKLIQEFQEDCRYHKVTFGFQVTGQVEPWCPGIGAGLHEGLDSSTVYKRLQPVCEAVKLEHC